MLNWLFGKPKRPRRRGWRPISIRSCPGWVKRAMTSDRLHAAWDDNETLIVTGRNYQYRVTATAVSQGQYDIGYVERRRRRR